MGLAFALDPTKDLLQYNCQSWTRQNGLPVNGIKTITQSKDGYLWLGTAVGLLRFDGVDFNLIDLTRVPGIRSTIVTSFANANDGGLWVGLENGSFGYLDGRSLSLRGKAAWGGLSLDVRSVSEAKDGTLWLATQHEAARITRAGDYEPVLTGSADLPANILFHFADSHERHWIATAAEGLFYWLDGKLVRLPDPVVVTTLGMAEDPEGNIWIGGPAGLLCYDSNLRRKEVPPLDASIRTLFIDRRGTLWIGTDGAGLVRYQHGVYSFLRKSDGLASDYVTTLMDDSEGDLWIGTSGGLSQLRDVKFAAENPAQDPSADVATAVCSSPRGGAWVAGRVGVTYFEGTTRQTYSTPAGLPAGVVKRVFEARNGEVYLVSGLTTLVILSGEKVAAIHAAPTLVVGMVEDAKGVIVSVGGALYRAGKDSLTPYPFAGAPPDFTWILNLAPGRDGAFWVASERGIFRVKDGTFQHWSVAEGLPEPSVWTIMEDRDGTVWASGSTSMVRLKDNKIRVIGRKDGLFDGNIYAIVPDDLGSFWIDSGRGIYRVSRQDLNDFADGRIGRVTSQVFDGPDSVTTADKTNGQERVGCKSLDGRIWFPSAKGVVIIDPAHIPINRTAPAVHIDRVLANRVEVGRNAPAVVRPGKGELEFDFVALSFAAPQRVKIRYQLEGYDKEWVEAENRRVALYTNLRPGPYRFRVTAANGDGVWNNTGATIAVTLQPFFYQTLWFQFAAIALAIVLLAALVGWRLRQYQQRQQALARANAELDQRVHERTAALAEASALLEAMLDNSPDLIYFKDRESRFVRFSKSFLARLGLTAPALLRGKTDADFYAADHAQPAYADEQEIIRTGNPIIGQLEKETYADGHVTWVLTTKMPWRDGAGAIVGTIGISKDVTSLKEAEAKLEQLHRQLLETSRQAGMAEVATSVLHNVGNVLNSVNVSATLVADHVRHSKTANIAKLVTLFDQHKTDLVAFLTQDPRGQTIPAYLGTLAEMLAAEQKVLIAELAHLCKNVEHIKDIVAMQQSYAGNSGVVETISVPDLLEDALRINAGSLARHTVEIFRDYQARPVVTTDKHKVLQILINLIRNAKYACDESGRTDKQITVRTTSDDRGVQLAIIDNGVGIPAENLTRIFNHGFTTRKHGHGFGLHGSALAAKELGGALTVQSDGPGHGATFILALPYQSDPPAHESSVR